MGVEVKPSGVRCNIQCQYCYEQPMRDVESGAPPLDLEAVKAQILQIGRRFNVFGGEPLVAPIDALAELFQLGYERWGGSSVQTNGTLVTDAHIEVFKRFRVSVGISVDGPDELNDARWSGSLARTRAATAASLASIDRLLAAGLSPGLIVTLSQTNASPTRLPRLVKWFEELSAKGVRSARIHVLEVETEEVGRTLALPTDEAVAALLAMVDLEKHHNIKFDLFDDMRALLCGSDAEVTCVFTGCDQFTTAAVLGIEPDGSRTNCGRTSKDGVNLLKPPSAGYERYVALYHTPQAYGGCNGCRFFSMCKGQCPGTASRGDWRNRSQECPIWFAAFETLEKELIASGFEPLSVSPLRPAVERYLVNAWRQGRRITLDEAVIRAREAEGRRVAQEDPRPAEAVSNG